MEKIVLTEKTLGLIKDRLSKFMKTPILEQNQFDQKPLKVKGWGEFQNQIYLSGKVTIHPFFKKDKNENVMIHVRYNKTDAGCYYKGDVFYFKGNVIIVEPKSSRFTSRSMFNKHKRYIERIVKVYLNDKEKRYVQYEEKRKEELYEEFYESVCDEIDEDL